MKVPGLTLVLVLAVALGVVSCDWRRATVTSDSPVEKLTDNADSVFVGVITDVLSQNVKTPEGDEIIVSDVTVLVEEKIKGDPPGQIRTRVPGGTVNGVTMVAFEHDDTPPVKGKRAAWFVNKGRAMAAYRVEEERVVGRGMSVSQLRDRVQGRQK